VRKFAGGKRPARDSRRRGGGGAAPFWSAAVRCDDRRVMVSRGAAPAQAPGRTAGGLSRRLWASPSLRYMRLVVTPRTRRGHPLLPRRSLDSPERASSPRPPDAGRDPGAGRSTLEIWTPGMLKFIDRVRCRPFGVSGQHPSSPSNSTYSRQAAILAAGVDRHRRATLTPVEDPTTRLEAPAASI